MGEEIEKERGRRDKRRSVRRAEGTGDGGEEEGTKKLARTKKAARERKEERLILPAYLQCLSCLSAASALGSVIAE